MVSTFLSDIRRSLKNCTRFFNYLFFFSHLFTYLFSTYLLTYIHMRYMYLSCIFNYSPEKERGGGRGALRRGQNSQGGTWALCHKTRLVALFTDLQGCILVLRTIFLPPPIFQLFCLFSCVRQKPSFSFFCSYFLSLFFLFPSFPFPFFPFSFPVPFFA